MTAEVTPPELRAAARALMDLALLRRRLTCEGARAAAKLMREMREVEAWLLARQDPLSAELSHWRRWFSSCAHLLARDDRWLARETRILQHALSAGCGTVAGLAHAWLGRWRGSEALMLRRPGAVPDNLVRAIETGGGAITALAAHPDGRRLWSASADAIVLWDGETGERLATLTGHGGPVRALCAAPPYLASSDAEGELRLWNMEDHLTVASVKAHEGSANALAVSPETGMLASAGEDGFVRTWRAPSLERAGEMSRGKACLRALACVYEDTWIAGGGVDFLAVLWMGTPGTSSPATIAGPRAAVTAIVACEPLASGHGEPATRKASGQRWAVVSSEDGQAYLCTGLNNAGFPLPVGQGDHLMTVAARPGSTRILLGSRDSVLTTRDLTQAAVNGRVGRHGGPVTAVLPGAEADVAISGGQDGVIAWWRTTAEWQGHSGAVSGLARLDHLTCSGGHDGSIVWWQDGKPIGRSLAMRNNPVTALARGSEVVVSGHESGQVRAHWPGEAGKSSHDDMGRHEGAISNLVYDPMTKVLVSAGWDGVAYLWTASEVGRQRHELSGHRGCVLALAVAAERDFVLSAGWDREILVHSLSRGGLLGRLRGHKSPIVAMRACGSTLVSAEDSGRIGFCALDELGSVAIQAGHNGSVTALIANQTLALSAGEDGYVSIWSLAERRRLFRVQASTAAVRDLALSPNGRYAVVAGGDSSLRVLSLESGDLSAGWLLGSGATACDWTEQGIACGTRAGEVLQFDFLPPRLLAAASWHPERLLLAVLHSDGVLSVGEWHEGAGFLESLAVRALDPKVAETTVGVTWSTSGQALRVAYANDELVFDAFTLAPAPAPEDAWAPSSELSPDGKWRATPGSAGVRPA